MKKSILTLLAALFIMPLALAAEPVKFIRVELTEFSQSNNPTEIKLRLPLSLIQALVPTINEHLGQLNAHSEGFDIKAIWAEIRDLGPNQFVEINSEEADVKVFSTENYFEVAVDGSDEGRINLKIPLALGDLLFGMDGNPDAGALLEELSRFDGDLLTIDGDKMTGRIWIETGSQ